MTKSTLEILEAKWADATTGDIDNDAYYGSFELWGELVRYESEGLETGTFSCGETTTFRHADTGYAFTILTDFEGATITDADDLVLINVWHWLQKIDAHYRNSTGSANFQLDLVWQMVSDEDQLLMAKYDALQRFYNKAA